MHLKNRFIEAGTMIEIKRYSDKNKKDWDNLISRSRNGTFLHYRDYMDYHANRFVDCSFTFTKKGKIEAVLPGNIKGSTFYSHQGLTFGGLISSDKIVTTDVLEIFELINKELKQLGIIEVIYKPSPHIYHILPAQEDIYALFRLGAIKTDCSISSTIIQSNKIKFSELRRRGVKKSIKAGVTISETTNFSQFWDILNNNLRSRYEKSAVHTLEEIQLLQSRFPNNIRLFIAEYLNNTIAGVVLFVMENIVHAQYIAANQEGKEIGALDHIFDEMINRVFIATPIFDFGHSSEQNGHYLNENLIFQKEGFGGKGVVYEIYKYTL